MDLSAGAQDLSVPKLTSAGNPEMAGKGLSGSAAADGESLAGAGMTAGSVTALSMNVLGYAMVARDGWKDYTEKTSGVTTIQGTMIFTDSGGDYYVRETGILPLIGSFISNSFTGDATQYGQKIYINGTGSHPIPIFYGSQEFKDIRKQYKDRVKDMEDEAEKVRKMSDFERQRYERYQNTTADAGGSPENPSSQEGSSTADARNTSHTGNDTASDSGSGPMDNASAPGDTTAYA